jgi:hypothetical protein
MGNLNVIGFKNPDDEFSQSVKQVLEEATAEKESLMGIAICAIDRQGKVVIWVSDSPRSAPLIGAVSYLQHRLLVGLDNNSYGPEDEDGD